MSRRTHKKSRAGCIRCKRRHIKCDETRPVCVNCSTANLECEYAGPRIATVGVSLTNYLDHSRASSPAIPTRTSTTIQASSSSLSPAALTPNSRPLYGTDSALNLDHLELLYHFCTVTYKTMSPQSDQQDTWQVGAFSMLSNTARLLSWCALIVLPLQFLRILQTPFGSDPCPPIPPRLAATTVSITYFLLY
jgi:hypothetical protein